MQLKDFDLIVRSSASDPHASSVERAGVVFPFGTGDPREVIKVAFDELLVETCAPRHDTHHAISRKNRPCLPAKPA